MAHTSGLSNVQSTLINQPLPQARATPEAFGAEVGRANAEAGASIAAAGKQLADIALDMQVEDNQRELNGGLNSLAELEYGLWSGDGSEINKGFANMSGDEAITAYSVMNEDYKKGVEAIIKGASGDFMRDELRRAFAGKKIAFDARNGLHLNQQRKVAAIRGAETAIELAVRGATIDYANDIEMVNHMGRAAWAAKNNGMIEGITDQKQLDLLEDIAMTRVARGAIEAAAANDDIGLAKELLKKYEKGYTIELRGKPTAFGQQLFGRDLKEMKVLVKNANVRVESQAAYQNLTDLYPGDYGKQRVEAEKNLTGAILDSTMDRLQRGELAKRTIRTQEENALLDNFNKGVNAGQNPQDMDNWDNLTFRQKEIFLAGARRVAAGAPTLPNYGLVGRFMRSTDEQKSNAPLGLIEQNVSPNQFIAIERESINASIRIGNPGPANRPLNLVTITTKFNAYIKRFGDAEMTDAEKGKARIELDEWLATPDGENADAAAVNEKLQEIFDGFTMVSLENEKLPGFAFGSGLGPIFDIGDVRLEDVIDLAQGFGDQNTIIRIQNSLAGKLGRAPTDLETAREYVKLLEKANK